MRKTAARKKIEAGMGKRRVRGKPGEKKET